LTSFEVILFLGAVLAGVVGALAGLGGGVLIVPLLTVAFGVDIRFAIGASIVSVIATSSGAAAAYVRDHIASLRIGMFLEIGTTAGAITGAFLAGWLPVRWIYIVFGGAVLYSAAVMVRRPALRHHGAKRPDPISERLRLEGSYFDEAAGAEIVYRAERPRLALVLMYAAGGLSGLLGIGAGAFKVPALDLAMGLPIKVSTATSNFMIGVTAAASAGVYFARGEIDPFVAAPVALGVVGGALIGSRLLPKLESGSVRIAFAVVLAVVAVQMLLKSLR
jgi:uncharacterized protein